MGLKLKHKRKIKYKNSIQHIVAKHKCTHDRANIHSVRLSPKLCKSLQHLHRGQITLQPNTKQA